MSQNQACQPESDIKQMLSTLLYQLYQSVFYQFTWQLEPKAAQGF